jgi:diguanylate cyclase (GGDEF)-like protein
MKNRQFYTFLDRQILVVLGLSLGPGIGYLFLGYLYDALVPTASWYGLLLALSVWGYTLHRQYDFDQMSRESLSRWYVRVSYFYYLIFVLWTVIFILIVPRTEHDLHYVAIFTQIGASVVSSTLLFSDRRLFIPTITILVVPLAVYFSQIGEWYGYVLTIFSLILWWVLYYASNSGYQLLQQSYQQSSRDQLTGMYNRAFFIDSMEQMINTIRKTDKYCCLILIDLDYFKTINDSLGHDIGDVLLKEVAQRMLAVVPEDAVAARMGGDEFIVITPTAEGRNSCTENAMRLAERVREELKKIYEIERHHLYISASIGVSVIHDPDSKANKYIKEADIAMYEVKDRGRDGVVLFTDEVSSRVENNLEIERLLHLALERDEIYLNYQPQVDSQQKIIGCEVLVRWNSQVLGHIPPDKFIPIAEKTGLILEIGNYVLEQAMKTLKDWEDKGVQLEQYSINISMRQFFFHSFFEHLQQLCKQYMCESDKRRIVLELTESTMADELDRLIEMMDHFRSSGMRFSIDDFGTGYSSLSYLRQVPLDEIKIDRSFTSQIGVEESSETMIKTILHLAKIFDLKVVAEGVETSEQRDFLLENDCDYLQGYYFSRPVDKQTFEELFSQHQGVLPATRAS